MPNTHKFITNDLVLLPNVTPEMANGADSKHNSACGPRFVYERLVRWAAEEWQRRYPGQDCLSVWSVAACANRLAHTRLKVGRRVSSGRFLSAEPVFSDVTTPITSFRTNGRRILFENSVGAYLFRFELGVEQYPVLFVSAYGNDDDDFDQVSIALVPLPIIKIWDEFERICYRLSNALEHSPKIHVIGSPQEAFEPKVAWEDVILSETLKTDLRRDMETFFSEGAALYRKLNLPPFRKLLLVGPPGTGKSTLCAALAKSALDRKCIVVYISTADQESGFNKISRAVRIASNSRYPTLLIIEELDSYLQDKTEKSQILNVLDGMESPNNPKGTLLIATTNFPEIIDERIAKRPGRIDRVIYVPPIQTIDEAERMLRRYMGDHYRDDHAAVLPKLINQTGAFVREVSLYARMLAVAEGKAEITIEALRESVKRLSTQVNASGDFIPRRPFGFGTPTQPDREEAVAEHD